MKIDWEGQDSVIFINPCYRDKEKRQFKKILQFSSDYPGHLWLATSGSTVSKWVGLSKIALLTSAQAVNHHLESTSSDRWVQTLPNFHVGGLSIWARAFLSGAQVIQARKKKWDPVHFYQLLKNKKATLTSVVPAQLYDLIHLQLKAPPTLRAILVGGGRLMPLLYEQAIQLGWNLLPTYGMTECASQVATADLGSWEIGSYPTLTVLPHLIACQDSESRLRFKGDSLLSLYAIYRNRKWMLWDPKVDGWFLSEDRGKVAHNKIYVEGRIDQAIKIGGETVDFYQLEACFQELCMKRGLKGEATLVPIPDQRLGHQIHLAITEATLKDVQSIIDNFQQAVLPFERIRQVHCLPYFPKSSLHKIKRQTLLEMILDKNDQTV